MECTAPPPKELGRRTVFLRLRVYASVDELFKAAETAWRSGSLDPAVIHTVCHAPSMQSRS